MARRRWTREHEERVERILALMRREARPFEDTSRDAVAARIALPFSEWCHVYLPHWFQAEDAPWHAEADRLRDVEGLPVFMCWARGTGKTTRYSIADVLHAILTRRRRLIILGAKTVDAAAEKSDLIQLELRHNARLRSDYGSRIAPQPSQAAVENWRANGVRVRCLGTGQSLRGAVEAGRRPDMFVGDDLEDNLIAASRRREEKLWRWLWSDIYPALEGAGQRAHMRVLGTMYRRGCMMLRARDMAEQTDAQGRPLCLYQSYPLYDEEGRSTWPGRYSDQQVQRAIAIMGPRLARAELGCQPLADDAPIQPEWPQQFDLRLVPPSDIARMRKVAYLDPSATASETSDYKALVVLGSYPDRPEVYCLHAWLRRGASPEEVVGQLLWVQDRFPGVLLAAEANGFQRLYWDILRLTCEKRRRPVPYIRGVINRLNKVDRMLAWQGEFSQRLCFFDLREGDQRLLVDQWLDLPDGDHDDGPDAWDGARRLLGYAGPGIRAMGYGQELEREGPWLDPENPAIWTEVA